MFLFSVTEPSNEINPGVPFLMKGGKPVIVLAKYDNYELTLGMDPAFDKHAAQAVKMAQASCMYAAEIIRHKGILQLVEEKDKQSKEAIVFLQTAPAEGGTLRLSSNLLQEDIAFDRGGTPKVFKEWGHFNTSVGVEVLNPEHVRIDDDGVLHWDVDGLEGAPPPPVIIRLTNGASFRVWRDNHEKDNIAPLFVVSWSVFLNHSTRQVERRLQTIIPNNPGQFLRWKNPPENMKSV